MSRQISQDHEAKQHRPEVWEEIIQQKQKVAHPSQHFEYYHSKVLEASSQGFESHPSFASCGVTYTPNTYEDFSFKIVDEFNNFQIVLVQVFIGSFSISLKIFSSEHQNPLFKTKSSAEGNFGKLFFRDYFGQTLAVKVMPFYLQMNLSEKRKVFSKTLKQYCISKISSCLGVGPAMPSVSGFDLIIYSNSIQFLMEKCDPLTVCSLQHSQSLLASLVKLHQHKIMHMDINPSNVMFSKSLNKAVFIDFGLSSIIEEDCGFETFTFFRGTPQFVCKEMLHLFSEDSPGGLVDLYFNDLTSYETTIKCFQKMAEIKEGSCYIDVLQMNREAQGRVDHSCQIEYQNYSLFLMFKHQCFFQSQNMKQTLIKHKEVYIKQYPKDLLKLLLNLLPSSIVEDIVFTEITELSSSDQYSDLITKIKYLHETDFKEKYNPDEAISSFKPLYLVEDPQKEADEMNNEVSMIKNLKDQQYFELCTDKSEYYSILIKCLRFDQRNFDVETKYQVASCFMKFIEKQEQIKDKDQIAVFQKVFQYLLRYCLTDASPEWRNRNRLDLLLQAVLTDANILDELILLGKIVQQEVNFDELFDLYCELLKICRTFDIKYTFQDHSVGLAVMAKTKEVLNTLCLQIGSITDKLNLQQLTIVKMLIAIMQFRTSMKKIDEDLYCEVQKITIPSVRYELTQFLLMTKVDSYQKNSIKKYEYLEIVWRVKEEQLFASKEFKKRKFIDVLYWDWFFATSSLMITSIQKMAQSIEEIINFDLIYSHLIFKHGNKNLNLLLKKEKQTPILFRQQMLTFIQVCFKDCRFQTFYASLKYFVESLKYIPICQKYLELFQQLQAEYAKYCQRELVIFKHSEGYPTSWKIKPLPDILWGHHTNIYNLLKLQKILNSPFYDLYNDALARQAWKFMTKYALREYCEDEELFEFLKWEQRLVKHRSSCCQQQYFFIKRQLQMLEIVDSPYRHLDLLNIFFHIRSRCYRDHFSFQAKKCFEDRIQIIIFWIFNYTTYQDLFIPFYLLDDKKDTDENLAQILFILHQRGAKEEMYSFLKKIVSIISKSPKKMFIKLFGSNIISILSHTELFVHRKFVEYVDVKQHFGPISWDNRYCLIIYVCALISKVTDKQILIILCSQLIKHYIFNSIKESIERQAIMRKVYFTCFSLKHQNSYFP